MKIVSLADLPTTFRERAAFLRENAAAEQAATAWEKAAIEVESALRGHELEALKLRVASAESGYSVDHLRRLLRECAIPNAGTAREMRILRMHLPRKPGHRVAPHAKSGPSSRLQAARAVAGKKDP